MDWGFGKDLNKPIKTDKKTKQEEGWVLIRYYLKNIANIWKSKSFIETTIKTGLEKELWNRWDKAEEVAKKYLFGNKTKTDLKLALEKLYQICLKIYNLSK